MSGNLIITVTSNNEEHSGTFPVSGISLGSTFNFSNGSQFLGDIQNQQWSCGSCGIIDGNIGVGVLLRKNEVENKLKIDILNLQKRGERWDSPNYPKAIVSGLGIHHNPLIPSTVKVEWEESGKITKVDEKQIE